MPVQGTCSRCGYISSQILCKACVLLEGLNRGLPRVGIGKATGGNMSAIVKKYGVREEEKGEDGRRHHGGGEGEGLERGKGEMGGCGSCACDSNKRTCRDPSTLLDVTRPDIEF